MENTKPPGRVLTFYSYKGGTGRSMAVANVAWLLAMSGYKVVVIDWDLEAPGLHRYFHPFLSDPDLTQSDGVIDFVIRFTEEASVKGLDEVLPKDWYVPYSNIGHCALSLDYAFPREGLLDFIPAGRQGDRYAENVNSFNWKNFYENLGGYSVIDEMRRLLCEDYEYVLVDSRTGVSDTSGICTVQLPDDVIICFTLNFQSVRGASSAAMSILEQRAGKREVRIFPVPMRVETAELVKRDRVTAYAKSRFLDLIDAKSIPAGLPREKYWDEVEVPYIEFYAFEEQLAWFLETPSQVTGVLASMKRLVGHAMGKNVLGLPGPTDEDRREVLERYAGVWTQQMQTQPVLAVPRTSVYVSYNELDRDGAESLRAAIAGQIGDLYGASDLTRDAKWSDAFRAGLQRSKAMLLLIGNHGLSSMQQRELAVAADYKSKARSDLRIVPVLMVGADVKQDRAVSEAPLDLRGESNRGAVAATITATLAAVSRPGGTVSCPYPGLRPFRTEEAELFFGRERLTEQLLEQVRHSKSVIVGGPVGCGKTSAVLAGLLPRLLVPDASGIVWKTVVFSMDRNPFQSLAEALVGAGEAARSEEQYATECASLSADLQRGNPSGLREFVTSTLGVWPSADRLLIVADDVSDLQSAALRLLRELTETAPVTVLAVTDSQETIPRLNREETRSAIESSTHRAGLEIESVLVDTLLNETENQPRPLPLLQFLQRRIWERRSVGGLTLAAYHEIGGGGNAVQNWADQQIAALSPDRQTRAMGLLARFVTVPESGPPSLRTVSSALLDRRWQNDVDSMVAAGLIVKKTPLLGEPDEYRLLDAILLERWPRFAGHVEQDRTFLSWRQTIESAVQAKAKARSPDSILPSFGGILRGEALSYATQALADRRSDLTDLEAVLIEELVAYRQGLLRRSARTEAARVAGRAVELEDLSRQFWIYSVTAVVAGIVVVAVLVWLILQAWTWLTHVG
jgi:cellulose biosynthesis protein BcsQ